MPNEVIDIQRPLVIPSAAPGTKKRLYIQKGLHGGLNVGLDDASKSRTARLLREVRLSGAATLYQSTAGVAIQGTYKIENYDSFTSYTVSISAGSVSITGDTITVTSPTTPGNIYLTVNGEHSKIIVKPPAVVAPTITYPTNSIVLGPSFTATASAFTTSGPADTCASVTWQVSTDPDFTTLVIDSTSAGSNTSKSFVGMAYNTLYYARVRYTGTALGASLWSATAIFNIQLKGMVSGEVKLFPPTDAVINERFGSWMAVDYTHTLLVVGSIYGAGVSGHGGRFTTYKKVDTTWTRDQVVSIPGVAEIDFTGAIAALSPTGEWLAIGAPGRSDQAANAGAVILYRRVNGSFVEHMTLRQAASTVDAYFGSSVAIDATGNRIAVGATGALSNQGSVHIFVYENDSWTEEVVLTPAGSLVGDQVGNSLSMNSVGDLLVIGASSSVINGTKTGKAYVYSRVGTTWSLIQTLYSGSGVANGGYGCAVQVAPDGEEVFIGAKGETDSAVACGKLYVYRKIDKGWDLVYTLVPSDKTAGQSFGDSVSIGTQGVRIAIGAPDDNGQGAVYVFGKSAGVWSQSVKVVPTVRHAAESFGDTVVLSFDESVLYSGAPRSALTAVGGGQVYQFN